MTTGKYIFSIEERKLSNLAIAKTNIQSTINGVKGVMESFYAYMKNKNKEVECTKSGNTNIINIEFNDQEKRFWISRIKFTTQDWPFTISVLNKEKFDYVILLQDKTKEQEKTKRFDNEKAYIISYDIIQKIYYKHKPNQDSTRLYVNEKRIKEIATMPKELEMADSDTSLFQAILGLF